MYSYYPQGYGNPECPYIEPQFTPSYQPTPSLHYAPMGTTYSPMSHYNPLAASYTPATAINASVQNNIPMLLLFPNPLPNGNNGAILHEMPPRFGHPAQYFDQALYGQHALSALGGQSPWQQRPQYKIIPANPLVPPIAGGQSYLGSAVGADREVAFTWHNRPTKVGLYRMAIPINEAIICQERKGAYGIVECLPESFEVNLPFKSPVFAGAFAQFTTQDKQARLVLGEEVENAFNADQIHFGENIGQYAFLNRPYIYLTKRDEGSLAPHQIEAIFCYVVLTEDAITQGLDPNTTTSYFNKKGEIIFETDAMGNRWDNPNLGGTVGAVVIGFGAVIALGLVVTGFLGILAKLGLFGQRAREAVTTLVAAGEKKVREITSSILSVAGGFLQAAAPWIIGGAVLYGLLRSWL